MGETRPSFQHQEQSRPLSGTPAALVVPGVPTFSVDAGFWYSIPDHLMGSVELGARVRIPLGGRKVRGFVIDTASDRSGRLKDIAGVSGEIPVFDSKLLRSLQWTAQHYVAPLSVVLEKSAPPTLPKSREAPGSGPVDFASPDDGISPFLSAVAKGERRPVAAFVMPWNDSTWVDAIGPILAAGHTAMVIAATVKEAASLANIALEKFGQSVVLIPEGTTSSVTRAWEEAQGRAKLVIGTPKLATWKVSHLRLAVVVEESRRAMKDRQTPTIHVRDILRTRARTEGFGLMFVGPTPSVELIASGADITQITRAWGLVEVVDRREDPPGTGFLSDRTVAALKSSLRDDGKAFVFTHIRAGASSARCVGCRAMHRCRRCGSNMGSLSMCPRCGTDNDKCAKCGGSEFESMGSIPSRLIAEVSTRIGQGTVGQVGDERPVIVGTERDLAGLEGLGMAVAVDVDGLLFGPNYRSSEEALRVLVRLIGSVQRQRGHRTILQTSDPESALIAALRRAEPIPYLEGVLATRARDGFPPASEMMAFETRSVDPAIVSEALDKTFSGMLLGPVVSGDGHRWLIQGDLSRGKAELRPIVQRLRDSGATVRVDVDPIDL